MIDRNDLRCPTCGSLQLRQASIKENTTREYREANGIEFDIVKLICEPPDPTWYGCRMCNTEFNGEGKIYDIRKMYPFCKSPNGELE